MTPVKVLKMFAVVDGVTLSFSSVDDNIHLQQLGGGAAWPPVSPLLVKKQLAQLLEKPPIP